MRQLHYLPHCFHEHVDLIPRDDQRRGGFQKHEVVSPCRVDTRSVSFRAAGPNVLVARAIVACRCYFVITIEVGLFAIVYDATEVRSPLFGSRLND